MSNKQSKIKEKNQQRQEFLLSFFKDSGYQELPINGFWLVKKWNGNSESWQVAIYKEESYKKYKAFSENERALERNHFNSI